MNRIITIGKNPSIRHNKKITNPLILCLISFITLNQTFGQTGSYNLGSKDAFINSLTAEEKGGIKTIHLGPNASVDVEMVIQEQNGKKTSFTGIVQGEVEGTFSFLSDAKSSYGVIYYPNSNASWKIEEDDMGNMQAKAIDKNEILCVDFDVAPQTEVSTTKRKPGWKQPAYESLPGAAAVVYLDFDGETVSNTNWANGGTINAAASGFSDNGIRQVWEEVSEDFRPWVVNVTTDRAVYDAARTGSRIMCIITPTTSAAPGAGGVAYIGEFSRNRDEPCWTFNGASNGQVSSCGTTCSHEVGHTLNLQHDGGNTSANYDPGDGYWCPTMGACFDDDIKHWSKGDYGGANNQQNDINVISNNTNFDYRADDHGDDLNNATEIVHSNGNIDPELNNGLIGRNTDVDVFSFITAGGDIDITVKNTDISYINLDIQARLMDATGNVLETVNPDRAVAARINTTLDAGTYFIEVDGQGRGNWSSGYDYDDYFSMGEYLIEGTYNPGSNNQPPTANFGFEIKCGEVTFTDKSLNTVDSFEWNFGDGSPNSSEENPTHTYLQSGTYTVSLTTTNQFGDDTKTEEIVIDIPVAPNANDVEVCAGGDVTLTASGSDGYVWYENDGTTVAGEGATLELTNVTQSDTYYVSGGGASVIEKAGPTSIPSSGGYFDNNDQRGLFIEVNEPVIWKSTVVDAGNAGDRVFSVRDNDDGNVIESVTVFVPQGESRVELNLPLEPGVSAFLAIEGDGQALNLWRDNDHNANDYPYTTPSGSVSITGTNASSELTFYYYFYDNEFESASCESGKTEVSVDVVDSPTAPTITNNGSNLSVPDNYDTYQWYINGQEIPGATGPTYSAEENGLYSVEVGNGGDCSTLSDEVNVLNVGIRTITKTKFSFYPNPADDIVQISGLDKEVVIQLIDAKGQIISEQLSKDMIDISRLEKGIYSLIIDGSYSGKMIKK